MILATTLSQGWNPLNSYHRACCQVVPDLLSDYQLRGSSPCTCINNYLAKKKKSLKFLFCWENLLNPIILFFPYLLLEKVTTFNVHKTNSCNWGFFHGEQIQMEPANCVSVGNFLLYVSQLFYIKTSSKMINIEWNLISFPLSHTWKFRLGILWRVWSPICECILTELPLYLGERLPEPFAQNIITMGVKLFLKDTEFSFMPRLLISLYSLQTYSIPLISLYLIYVFAN